MDPVTAFGLAAGVLQVVDFSFRALKQCREIYKDGSLAEHRNTAEVVGHLADTTNRLRATVDQTSKPISPRDSEIYDLSTKCSETAAELLTELEKLNLKPGVGFRQAVSKSVRSFRRKAFIAEVERKLEKYQTILDTSILVDLNSRSIQQRDDFQELDENIQDLVTAMNQGRDTVAQLLADQSLAIRDHIDRGLDSHALKISHVRAQEQFKDSLSFSGMFSRQEDIAEEHQGTYQWIFQPSYDGESQKVDEEPGVTGKGNDVLLDKHEARDDRKRGQQWSHFVTWLEQGKEIYWLNGKPGSGKSTLMKFIASNIWENAASNEAMVKWAGDNEVVTASFYFWSLGSTGLQKSLQGLLRSLLHQIASQRQDLISILMEDLQRSAQDSDPSRALQVYEWTERRLRSMLRHFLDHKPSSVSLCVFIDGLDEMVGDEEILIDTLRLLNDAPHTKVCVSSRPEQIFRQGLSGSPQIRLQDLNHEDIKKTTTENLLPALKECFPHDEEEICWLVKDVISKAEGVFLWLELVMKDIKRGARYNDDSLLELEERLKITPNSIDGLYEQMLGRLDKVYLQEAGRYFRFLMADRKPVGHAIPTTLIDFVCAESVHWDHIRRGDTAWFHSPDFSKTCQHVETRLLTRCAGLVEVEHQSPDVLKGEIESTSRFLGYFRTLDLPPNQENHNVCHQLREVKFIHKSAIDFLQTHKQAFLQNRDEGSATELSLLRGTTGVLSVMPVAISAEKFRISRIGQQSIAEHISVTMNLLASFAASITFSEEPTLDNVAVGMVDDVYQIIERVDASMYDPDHHWYQYYNLCYYASLQLERSPFRNVHLFAAFLGCHNYVSYHRSLGTYSLKDNNYLLACTIHGLMRHFLDYSHFPEYCALIEDILCQGADPNSSLDVHEHFDQSRCKYTISAWGAFLYRVVPNLALILNPFVPNGPTLDQVPQYFKALMESFLSRSVDVNTSIGHFIRLYDGDTEPGCYRIWKIEIEDTPLSYLMRAMNSNKHHIISPLVNLLRERGALERTRFRFVAVDRMRIYQVSEEESQHLCEAWPRQDGTSNEDRDSFLGAFLEIEASLTKLDTGNEEINLNWESSW